MNDDRLDRLRAALKLRLSRVTVAAESLNHRHNVSAILRTCDAVGLHTVHLVAGDAHPAPSPARGAERWLDLRHHAQAADAIREIRASGQRLYVADLSDDAVTPEQVPVDEPVCLWFGAELVGVSAEARAAADGVVSIPMRGLAQSLNVSVAAALCLRPVAERARALGDSALLSTAQRHAVWAEWERRLRERQRLADAEDLGAWSSAP